VGYSEPALPPHLKVTTNPIVKGAPNSVVSSVLECYGGGREGDDTKDVNFSLLLFFLFFSFLLSGALCSPSVEGFAVVVNEFSSAL
jgi:hypothetical protein